MNKQNLYVISFKAFGDLVIAVTCCKNAPFELRNRLQMLIGDHLLPLFGAMQTELPYSVLHHGEGGMPAVFEVRKKGLSSAFRSALSLRCAVRTAGVPQDSVIVSDRLGVRERYIVHGWKSAAIPSLNNIYLSYDSFFSGGRTSATPLLPQSTAFGPLRIFPGSRMAEKNLPVGLIREIMAAASARALPVELMLLADERPDLQQTDLPHKVVPRNFVAMVDAVHGSSKVISADSMPAHIAEYVGRDVFVFSPVPNRYWLPKSSYLRQRDALFDEGCASSRFNDFINSVA